MKSIYTPAKKKKASEREGRKEELIDEDEKGICASLSQSLDCYHLDCNLVTSRKGKLPHFIKVRQLIIFHDSSTM